MLTKGTFKIYFLGTELNGRNSFGNRRSAVLATQAAIRKYKDEVKYHFGREEWAVVI
jgi:hypothetical protein